MRVQDIMSTPVLSVSPDRSLKAVARLFDRNRISAVPVVEDGRVIGIVSKTDIIEREQAFEVGVAAGWLGRRVRHGRAAPRARTARDAMTSPALTVSPVLSAVGSAWLMTEHDAHHLPVVDRGKLVGIVTRSDLVRAFARSDDQIRAEIIGEILPALTLSANDIAVSVSNGEVVLAGEIEDELTARCLPHAVRSVIGVVEVRCDLRAGRPTPLVDVVSPTL
jgi:CBS domain-containing protein